MSRRDTKIIEIIDNEQEKALAEIKKTKDRITFTPRNIKLLALEGTTPCK